MSKADDLGASSSFGAATQARSGRRRLIDQAAGEAPADPSRVPLGQLVGNPENPREDLGELSELAQSLTEQGLLQPLHVLSRRAYLQVHPEHEDAVGQASFVVVNGNRRLAAAAVAGLETVAVHMREQHSTEEGEAGLRAAVLAENIHRQDLHPLEEAQEIDKLLGLGLTRSQAASRLGKSNGWVTQRLTLLELHPDLQGELREGILKLAHARELGKLDHEQQMAAYQEQRDGFYAVKPHPHQADAASDGDPGSEDSPAPAAGESEGAKSPQASGRLTLNLHSDEPEALAETFYKELSAGMEAHQLRRFIQFLAARL